MVYKSFRINFIIRIVALSATIFLLFYLVAEKELYFTAALTFIAITYQIVAIIKYVEKTNRLLKNFLESIRYSDFTRNFQVQGLGSSFDKLQESFNAEIGRASCRERVYAPV